MMRVRRRKLVEQTRVEQTTTKTIPVLPVPYLIVPRASPMKPAKDLFKDVFIEPTTPETTIGVDFINGIPILKKREKNEIKK